MNKSHLIIVFLLGVIVGLLSWNILELAQPQYAWGDATGGGTGGTTNGFIAVTGAVTNSFSGLWVLDCRDTEHTPSLCLYLPNNSGRKVMLAAARRIKYDFKLVCYNDDTSKRNRNLHPARMREKIEEMNKEEEEKK